MIQEKLTKTQVLYKSKIFLVYRVIVKAPESSS